MKHENQQILKKNALVLAASLAAASQVYGTEPNDNIHVIGDCRIDRIQLEHFELDSISKTSVKFEMIEEDSSGNKVATPVFVALPIGDSLGVSMFTDEPRKHHVSFTDVVPGNRLSATFPLTLGRVVNCRAIVKKL